MDTMRQPFDLLLTLAGDEVMADLFSPGAAVDSWLRVEVALAAAESEVGIVPAGAAEAIASVASVDLLDLPRLWHDSRNVGYPILPLVRQLDELLPEEHRGFAHLGATTQDIMDTGLALQLVAASDRLLTLLDQVGDGLAVDAKRYATTVMAARTHAQHAVPTTWGAKLAGLLGEFTRHRTRLLRVRDAVGYASLFGAGGTSAGYGPQIADIRDRCAAHLGLRAEVVSHHVARDCLAEWGAQAAALCATGARLGREVIDLARNEIGEVSEQTGHLRGASSTMPQKANPISSEVLVGLATTAGAISSGLWRTMEAGHDRAAGEWQAEWQLLPMLAQQAATSVATCVELLENLQIFPQTMRRNLEIDHGLVMAEAYMITLAAPLGRETAHDLVYAAARDARAAHMSLFDAVRARLPEESAHVLPAPILPDAYLGETERMVETAVSDWRAGGRTEAVI
jgi:3-carboxy-cis,cis-muconate cycloisomerase